MTDELERLAREATPGPWRTDTGVHDNVVRAEGDFEWIGVAGARHDLGDPVFAGQVSNRGGQHKADAAYIAAASPDVILALLEERRVLREALTTITSMGPIGPFAFVTDELAAAQYVAKAALQAEPARAEEGAS